jgi:hypothetical protein
MNVFWILVAVLFLFLLKESKNNYLKKIIGSFLIVFGLFVFNPLPSLDDVILYPIFSVWANWDVSNLKENLLPYTFITGVVGLLISYAGLYLTGHSLQYLVNKIKRIIK